MQQRVEQMNFMLSSLKKARETFTARKQLQEKAIHLRHKIASIKTTTTTNNNNNPAQSNNNNNIHKHRDALYSEIFQVLHRALRMEKDALGERHPQVADTTQLFADLYLERNQHAQAIRSMRTAVQILKLALGKHHPRTCVAVRQLARMYESSCSWKREKQNRDDDNDNENDKGQSSADHLQQAILHYGEAADGFRECFGRNHSVVGATLNNTAVLYIQKGDYTKAIEKLSDALTCYEASPTIIADGAQVWKNMGECYMRRGDFESAHFAYTSALEVQRDARFQAETAGEEIAAAFDDASIGDTLLRLGRTMKETMRYDDSYKIYTEALLIYRMHYRTTKKLKEGGMADAKDRLAHTVYCMAEVQEIRGEYTEALKLFSDALQLRLESDATRSVNRMNMVHCAMALCGVGTVHMRLGEFTDAKLGFQEALRYLKAHGVPEDHDLMVMINGRLQSALEERPSLGSGSFSDESTESSIIKKTNKARELDMLSQEQVEVGDYDAAITSLASALAIRRRKLTKRQKAGDGSTESYLKEKEEVADTLGRFALLLVKKNETKQACMLLKEALRMHIANGFTEDHHSVMELNQRLDELNGAETAHTPEFIYL